MTILLIDELTKSEPIFKGIIYCLSRAASSDILGIVFRGFWMFILVDLKLVLSTVLNT